MPTVLITGAGRGLGLEFAKQYAADGWQVIACVRNPDKADAARALKPLNERQIFGKSIFLFDGIDRARLAALGELHKPSVADLFVATMKGTYA